MTDQQPAMTTAMAEQPEPPEEQHRDQQVDQLQEGKTPSEETTLYTSISFLKKRPDITHAQFYHHWSTIHGPLALPWMKRHKFRSYTQYHTLPSLNAPGTFSPIGPENPDGQNADILREYDGAAVVEVDSLETFQKAFEDQYYKNVIAEDEKLFLDKESGVLRTRAEAKKILKLL